MPPLIAINCLLLSSPCDNETEMSLCDLHQFACYYYVAVCSSVFAGRRADSARGFRGPVVEMRWVNIVQVLHPEDITVVLGLNFSFLKWESVCWEMCRWPELTSLTRCSPSLLHRGLERWDLIRDNFEFFGEKWTPKGHGCPPSCATLWHISASINIAINQWQCANFIVKQCLLG